jgi:hypothetical protein
MKKTNETYSPEHKGIFRTLVQFLPEIHSSRLHELSKWILDILEDEQRDNQARFSVDREQLIRYVLNPQPGAILVLRVVPSKSEEVKQ